MHPRELINRLLTYLSTGFAVLLAAAADVSRKIAISSKNSTLVAAYAAKCSIPKLGKIALNANPLLEDLAMHCSLLRLFRLGALLIGFSSTLVLSADNLFNDQGYRIQNFRSPTPLQHERATVITANELQHMLAQPTPPVLIDVYRNPWLHQQFTASEAHSNIPNSLWLANCGDGVLTDDWLNYCSDHLSKVTNHDKDYPLAFYCRSDCWLGWNAVHLAHSLGYRNLYWLRDGIDEWEQNGLPLELATPAAYNSPNP